MARAPRSSRWRCGAPPPPSRLACGGGRRGRAASARRVVFCPSSRRRRTASSMVIAAPRTRDAVFIMQRPRMPSVWPPAASYHPSRRGGGSGRPSFEEIFLGRFAARARARFRRRHQYRVDAPYLFFLLPAHLAGSWWAGGVFPPAVPAPYIFAATSAPPFARTHAPARCCLFARTCTCRLHLPYRLHTRTTRTHHPAYGAFHLPPLLPPRCRAPILRRPFSRPARAPSRCTTSPREHFAFRHLLSSFRRRRLSVMVMVPPRHHFCCARSDARCMPALLLLLLLRALRFLISSYRRSSRCLFLSPRVIFFFSPPPSCLLFFLHHRRGMQPVFLFHYNLFPPFASPSPRSCPSFIHLPSFLTLAAARLQCLPGSSFKRHLLS